MSNVAIIDYGMCNLESVYRAVEEAGGAPVITDQEREIEKATHIILPGVGAFGDAMHNIKIRSLDEILGEQVLERLIPFLGICLVLQSLLSFGTEYGECSGLGWISGTVERF